MRPARIVITAVAGVVALAAAAFGAIAWLLATEAGTAWLVARIEGRIPTPVAIGAVRGSLWHGLVLRDIAIDTATAQIRIDEARLRFDLNDLVRGEVSLDELGVSAMSYEGFQPEGGAGSGAPVSLPIRLIIREGSLQQLTVVIGGQSYVLGPASFTAEGSGDRVVVENLVASGMGFDVSGRAEVRFGAELELGADFSWSTTFNELIYAGNGSALGTWPQLTFHQDVTSPVALTADGEIIFEAGPFVSLEASWADLAWPLAPAAQSAEGVVRVTGWLAEYSFEGNGRVSVDGIESAAVASGAGSLNALEFASLELAGEYGEVSATGRLEFEPLAWAFDIQTTDLNPAARLPEWPGALDVTGEFSGHLAPELALALSNATISGELRAQPIAATGGVAYEAPNRWALDQLTVDLAGNRASVNGSAGATLALDVSIDAAALNLLAPGAEGTLRVDGRVGGTLEALELSGTAMANGLRYGDFSAGSLALDGEIVADASRSVALSVSAESAAWRDYALTNLSGRISGTAARHVAELDVLADYGSAQLRAEGAWSGSAWAGTLTSLIVEEPTVGQWLLTEPAELAAARGTAELSRACLEQGDARLCVLTRIGTDDDLTEIELTAFEMVTVAPALPENLSVTGRYDARLSLSGPLARPAASFEARGTDTVITYREFDEPPLEIPIDTLEVRGGMTEPGDLQMTAAFEGGAGARVDVDATLIELWAEQPGIDATISGRWSDLAMLSLLSPDVGEVGGTASIDLALGGRLRSPDIRGQARWTGGHVAVPRLGLLVEDIEAEVSSSDGLELLLQGSGIVGEGQVNIAGTTQVDPEAGWPTQLQVYGSGLQAVRLPEADIVVSPSLEVRAALPNIEVSGAFLIPRARLLLEELPPQAVEPSPDTVVHGAARPEEPRPLKVRADIRVGLGDDVRYTGAGLDVALSGAMGLVYESGRDAVASGTVNLSGQYAAYGQTLQIDQGQLVFAGPVTNPNLDVRAVRRVETITAGVQLSGTVEAPVTRVFSEPAMSEADALSYLLFGRPLSASGDAETATLESAAFAMGLQQALPVIQRVGETFGLDEFSVQTTSADTGELMAGKRLSPRLYIRYTYGLFNRLGGLLMRFDLNDRFSLETRSGDYRSMDLLYTVEKD